MPDFKLQDILVGNRYRVKPERVADCVTCNRQPFYYLVIEEIDKGVLVYSTYSAMGKKINQCFDCYKPEHLLPYQPETFSALREGDTFLDVDGRKNKVLFGNGLVIIAENQNGCSDFYSEKEFIRNEFAIHNHTPLITELTMDEIADKFGISVSNLKIKKT